MPLIEAQLESHFDAYNSIKREIDALVEVVGSGAELESQKGLILAKSEPYVRFLSSVTQASEDEVRNCVLELSNDNEFFQAMEAPLDRLAGATQDGLETGEIRVHTYSLYAVTRLLKPSIMVETGVANGKSSAFILRAINRNGTGKLISIDKPEFEDDPDSLNQGEAFIPRNLAVGWLVPKFLSNIWTLRLGDAAKLLPLLRQEFDDIDLFFHDSLHTYEHMKFELELALGWVRKGGAIVCDDIHNNGAFFESAAQSRNPGFAFGTMGMILT